MRLQSILNRVQKYNSFVYEGVEWRREEEKGESLNNYLLPFSPFGRARRASRMSAL